MSSSRLFLKLFFLCTGLNIALVAIFFIVVSHFQKSQIENQIRKRSYDAAVILRGHVENQIQIGQWEELSHLMHRLAAETGMRMTLVNAKGTVLADSQEKPERMENHRHRPELVQAENKGRGFASRHSLTLGVPMFYCALPVKYSGDVTALVRIGIPQTSIQEKVADFRRLLWILALVLGCSSTVVTYLIVGRAVRPLRQLADAAKAIESGNYQFRIEVDNKNELGSFGAAYNRIQEDLTTRVQQSSEYGERLATVLESMAEGVVVVDNNQHVLLANDASRLMLDFSLENVTDCPLNEVTRSRPLHNLITKVLTNEKTSVSEFEVSGRKRRALAVRATRLSGSPCPGAVLVMRDVTELRMLENMRREFVANVSHELKTPLASIKAYAETLRLGAIRDKDRSLQFVQRIEEQTEQLYQLILDLLQLARVESGQEVLDLADVPLGEIVSSCIVEHTDAATAKKISLVSQPPKQRVLVHADKHSLRTILDNLVDNAVKYTPDGGSVKIRWRPENGEVLIEIEDEGIGIARRDQDRVFERFYRVDKARSANLGSTGLGLSIVKHLTLVLGGSVQLTSELGKGSTFCVRLPPA